MSEPDDSDLGALAEQHWQRFRAACDAASLSVPERPGFVDAARHAFACSDYVARTCTRWPQFLHEQLESGRLERAAAAGETAARLRALIGPEVAGEPALMAVLRRFRHAEMLRIAWRDLAGAASLEETLTDLSALADACIDQALERLYAWQCERLGTPLDDRGRAQRLVVFGMGKLGAQELNFSSDVDLIFAFQGNGETDADTPRASIEFFMRLAKRVIRVLAEPTSEGFVFRVDMRLRPFGDSGPLVASGEALAHYYLTQGRSWERYAMVKARVVAGDREAGEELLGELRPFVYRRYLDFGAIASLREMKANIQREHRRRRRGVNVKLGDGGIRDIEFIGQALQLIRGGREPRLQVRGIVPALQRLARAGHLPDDVAANLVEAYVFLRRLENRLQMLNDEQTHELPAQPLERARIALAMGFDDWPSLIAELQRHNRAVSARFEATFHSEEHDAAGASADHPARELWRAELPKEEAARRLSALGYDDGPGVAERLSSLRQSIAYQALSRTARQRFDALLPRVLGACAEHVPPDETLYRTLALMRQVAGRSVYLALLYEHPEALVQLLRLFSASQWIAEFVAQHPILLDELLDPRSLYQLPERGALAAELADITGQIDPGDQEVYLDRLRQFKHTNMLRVAAVDLTSDIPVARVSDHLTDLAEVILHSVYDPLWDRLCARHGRPTCRIDGEVRFPRLAVIAYGKLGGLELGYGSDLDLVFLHDSEGEAQVTDGDKPIDNAAFFTRFCQKLIHCLATRTAAGVLYEIDTRLRPNGNSGLLVSSVQAFETYQRENAWTWEHQALVRARAVVAGAAMRERFARVRAQVLGRERERPALREDIVAMRRRLYDEFGTGKDLASELKHGPGGITDIEFMVQYHVLAAAAEHPRLLDFPDNLRLLEVLGSVGLLSAADARLLHDAYMALRERTHHLALGDSRHAGDSALQELRDSVSELWRRVMQP